jgi:hypothetical protein
MITSRDKFKGYVNNDMIFILLENAQYLIVSSPFYKLYVHLHKKLIRNKNINNLDKTWRE